MAKVGQFEVYISYGKINIYDKEGDYEENCLVFEPGALDDLVKAIEAYKEENGVRDEIADRLKNIASANGFDIDLTTLQRALKSRSEKRGEK